MASTTAITLKDGVQPDGALRALAADGAIVGAPPIEPDQIQPASLDLRLGAVAYRLRASFLPGDARVMDRLDDGLVLHRLDL
ncbi:MAG: 2'-deoxycytidine 5'-triphosphate deaminase, partial [Pseudomonadota bacterium]